MRGPLGGAYLRKKPLPKEEAPNATYPPHLPEEQLLPELAPNTASNLLDETIRLPGFHRAGPSTPLDEKNI